MDRTGPARTEKISTAKASPVKASFRAGFRWEMLHMFNRTVFHARNMNPNSAAFGVVNGQVNNPLQMQVARKVYW